jgi:hypothetical protein
MVRARAETVDAWTSDAGDDDGRERSADSERTRASPTTSLGPATRNTCFLSISNRTRECR